MKFTHVETVKALRQLQNKFGWLVDGSPNSIRLTKTVGGKPVTAVLIRRKDTKPPKYTLRPVQYPFRSYVSHFSYSEPENRSSRNKLAIFSVIKLLKEADVWEQVENAESYVVPNETFLAVNDRDSKERRKYKKEMQKTLNDEHLNMVN